MSWFFSTNIPWPSLYNPVLQIGGVFEPGGYYLDNPNEVFRFTLYWSLIFHTPLYILSSIYAFLNFIFPPRPSQHVFSIPLTKTKHNERSPSPPVSRYLHPAPGEHPWTLPPRMNARRSRITFSILVALFYLFCGLTGSVICSAIIGYILAGVYIAGGFNMSTWIPFVWAAIEALVGFLGVWPSIIDII